jgi:hypothetical protein
MIDDKGITYCIKGYERIFLPWRSIVTIEQHASAIMLHLTPQTKVPFRFPFVKLGKNVIAAINQVDIDQTELYGILLAHKNQVRSGEFNDVVVVIPQETPTRDMILLAISSVFFTVYFSTYYQSVALTTAIAGYLGIMFLWVAACSVYDYFLDA